MILPAPDLLRHVLPLERERVVPLINPAMLYNKHLGFRRGVAALEAEGNASYIKVREKVAHFLSPEVFSALYRPAGVYRFLPAESDGNSLYLYTQGPVERLNFPRQKDGEKLCLADFAGKPENGVRDTIALFAVTAGAEFLAASAKLAENGSLADSHLVNILGMCVAEASAEYMHARLRELWGIGDNLPPIDLFGTKYRGRRFSFGYPACPDLSGQDTLFSLLRPADIGVTLTQDYMMEPEASVSAIVFHNPAAKYFAAG